MSDSILQVFVFRDGAYVGNEVFPNGEVTLGRSHDADLVLEDQHVAPNQAVLTFDGAQATLLDLTQGDGTKVNRTTIQHSYVTPRDEIHLGPFTLKLKFLSKNGSSRPARATSLPPAPPPSAPGNGSALASSVGISPEAAERGEQHTEILHSRPPSVTGSQRRRRSGQPEAKVPTQVVRPRGESSRSLAIEHAIATEVGGPSPTQPDSERSLGPAAGTGEFSSLGTSDVISADPFGSAAPFNPANLESSSFEVMIDSAFLQSGDMPAAGNGAAHEPAAQVPAPSQTRAPVSEARRTPPPPPAPEPDYAARPSDVFRSPVSGTPTASSRPPNPTSIPSSASIPPSAPATQPAPGARQQHAQSAQPGAAEAAKNLAGAALARLKPPAKVEAPVRIPSSQPQDIEEELDEEDLDAEMRPGFSLASQMMTAPQSERAEQLSAVEIVSFVQQDVRTSHILADVGAQYVLGQKKDGHVIPDGGERGLKLVRLTGRGVVELEFPGTAQGQIRKQGRTANIDGLKKPEHASGRRGDRFRVALKAGMDAQLSFGGTAYAVRFVRPPSTVPAMKMGRINPFFFRAFGGAIAGHLFLGMLLVLLGPKTTFTSQGEAYAQIVEPPPRDVEIKPEPPPPPPPEPEPEPEPEPPKRVRQPKRRKPKRTRRARRPRPQPARGAKPRPVKSAGVLGAMGKLNLRVPGRRSMVQAVSNIDAVKAPGGSNFRVGALVGKTPSSDVQVGGGGGGKLLTRGSAALLKRGVGRLAGRRNGTVRGGVRRVSARRLKARGSISREAVAKVINENLGQVQYCYERALLKKPGLKGKLVLEWQISSSGRVSRVRQKMSTIQSAEVASCIIGKLKRWRFPKPRGGVVVVSYPFIFSSVGF